MSSESSVQPESSEDSDSNETPWTVEAHTIQLDSEQDELDVPDYLQSRVDGDQYTWHLYFANGGPSLAAGVRGDVWLNTIQGCEMVYIKGTSKAAHFWVRWRQGVNYSAKKWKGSAKKYSRSYHPWLRDRLLQFDGSGDIGWFPTRQFAIHRDIWNHSYKRCPADPPYTQLGAKWVARILAERLRSRCASAKSITQDQSNSHASSSKGSTPASESVATEEPEELPESNGSMSIGTINDQKRARSGSSACDRPFKRPREELQTPGSPRRSQSQTKAEAERSSPELPPETDIEQFLSGLPLSLVHHSHLFATLGIDLAHLVSLSYLPKYFRLKFVWSLKERGLSFMESLVLRNALNSLNADLKGEREDPQGEPETVTAFLALIHPSLARRAPVFEGLEVDVAHISVLAQLDEESYQEFEDALNAKGLTWVECFMVRATIRRNVPGEEEPLLTA